MDAFDHLELERTFDALQLGVLVTGPDLAFPGPRIIYANAAMEKLTGYSRAQLVGATPRILQGARTSKSVLQILVNELIEKRHFTAETYNYRPDGTEYIVKWWISPLFDAAGAIKGWLSVQRDVTEQLAERAALAATERRFHEFGEASSDFLWVRDAHSLRFEYLSPAFSSLYGVDRDYVLSDDHAQLWIELIHADDRQAALASLARLQAGERVTHEFRITRPSDGQVRWVRNTDFPFCDEEGRVSRIGGIAEDVTESKLSGDRQQILVAELQHRTRNLMAVVRSLATKTVSASHDLPDFQRRFQDRMDALARVQGLLSRLSGVDRVTLDDLISTEFRAVGSNSDNVELSGPVGVRLRSTTVQTLAMALHELATNAIKYGALSVPGARLAVRWRLEEQGPGGLPWLHISWNESGVAVLEDARRPARWGQGRELIERALPYQLEAETSFDLTEDGLRCTISMPVSGTNLDLAES